MTPRENKKVATGGEDRAPAWQPKDKTGWTLGHQYVGPCEDFLKNCMDRSTWNNAKIWKASLVWMRAGRCLLADSPEPDAPRNRLDKAAVHWRKFEVQEGTGMSEIYGTVASWLVSFAEKQTAAGERARLVMDWILSLDVNKTDLDDRDRTMIDFLLDTPPNGNA